MGSENNAYDFLDLAWDKTVHFRANRNFCKLLIIATFVCITKVYR